MRRDTSLDLESFKNFLTSSISRELVAVKKDSWKASRRPRMKNPATEKNAQQTNTAAPAKSASTSTEVRNRNQT